MSPQQHWRTVASYLDCIDDANEALDTHNGGISRRLVHARRQRARSTQPVPYARGLAGCHSADANFAGRRLAFTQRLDARRNGPRRSHRGQVQLHWRLRFPADFDAGIKTRRRVFPPRHHRRTSWSLRGRRPPPLSAVSAPVRERSSPAPNRLAHPCSDGNRHLAELPPV